SWRMPTRTRMSWRSVRTRASMSRRITTPHATNTASTNVARARIVVSMIVSLSNEAEPAQHVLGAACYNQGAVGWEFVVKLDFSVSQFAARRLDLHEQRFGLP